MTPDLTGEDYARLIRNLKEQRRGEVRQKILQNDIHAAGVALGGEITCELIEHRAQCEKEMIERIRKNDEEKERERAARRAARKANRVPRGRSEIVTEFVAKAQSQ